MGDTVVEIGPGNGALTHHIVDAASFAGGSVVLVEIDPKIRGHDGRQIRIEPGCSGCMRGRSGY